MRAYERLLRYIQFDTASSEASETCPSTPGQLVLGRALVEEMKEMGIADARIDEYGYVYGSIPANCEGQPAIGLIAHMDTVDDAPALPMNPQIVKGYDGSPIALGGNPDTLLSREMFPCLNSTLGDDLIVTDGKTILGADDKAGVSEILTLCERLLTHPEIRHGRLCIGFTPDEEIGRGADLFDVAGFGADFAYTVDGGLLPELEYENFNAASASVEVRGLSVHPGSAKDQMKNALTLAMELHGLLPPAETPEHTEGYEGFYHLTDLFGEVERAKMHYIIRDHDRQKFEARKAFLTRAVTYLNDKYGAGTFTLTLRDSYYNMREQIEQHMEIIDRAKAAFAAVGLTAKETPIRGGTDGARLSFMGLPCPNLPTGGMNFHGRFECITVQSMDRMVEVLTNLVRA